MENETKKIIMVDDNITNLMIVRNALAGKYEIFTTTSGRQLFKMLEKVAPDLILLDIEMPEMNGYEVLELLKSKESTADIPVIFLTGTIDLEAEMKGMNMGAIDYMTKPFSSQLLLKRLEVHLFYESHKNDL